MNKKFCSALITVSLAASAHAEIRPADLDVQGNIRTPTCTVAPSEGGIYDYGMLSTSLIPATGHAALQPKTQTWVADCGGNPTHLTFWVNDNRTGTNSAEGSLKTHLGLGRVPGREDSKIGYFTVRLHNAKVDGVDKSVLRFVPGQTRYWREPSWVLEYNHRVGWASDAGSGEGSNFNNAIQLGSHFEVDVEVRPYLANTSVMGGGLTEAVPLDGSLTLTYAFGL